MTPMQVRLLSLDLIDAPLLPARSVFDPAAFEELVTSIRANGLLQPVIVRDLGTRFRVVAGDRRRRAAKVAGLIEIPCTVRMLDDTEEIECMMTENLHRENPNAADEGAIFAALNEEACLTIDGIAQRIGKSAPYVQTRLALVRGPEDIREAVRLGEISFSVGRELQRVTHDADRAYLLYHVKAGGANTNLARRWANEKILERARVPEGPVPDGAPYTPPPPENTLGACDWHRGKVPLNGLLSFQVCGPCYTELTRARDHLMRLERSAKEEPDDVAGKIPDS